MSTRDDLDAVHDRAAYVWEGRGNWNLAPREEREIGYTAFAGAWDAISEQFIAEGWRKMPSAEEVEAVVQRHWEAWTGRESQDFSTIVATSILALMDGGE